MYFEKSGCYMGSFENSYIPENPRTPPIFYISQTVIPFKKLTSEPFKTIHQLHEPEQEHCCFTIDPLIRKIEPEKSKKERCCFTKSVEINILKLLQNQKPSKSNKNAADFAPEPTKNLPENVAGEARRRKPTSSAGGVVAGGAVAGRRKQGVVQLNGNRRLEVRGKERAAMLMLFPLVFLGQKSGIPFCTPIFGQDCCEAPIWLQEKT
ncbi:hypothetical protein LXL04_020804 [Taraxacum kok-saghyz]